MSERPIESAGMVSGEIPEQGQTLRLHETPAEQILDTALERVGDSTLPLAERGVLYAMLRGLRLRIDRALRPVTVEIEQEMAKVDAREWGPLRLSWRAVDPKYVCNDEGNWNDIEVQDQLAEWWQLAAYRPFIRRIPAHSEIDTATLGKAVANGDPGARELYGLLNERRFRTEEGRTASLSVKEGKAA